MQKRAGSAPKDPQCARGARGKGPGRRRAAFSSAPRGQGCVQRTQWAPPGQPPAHVHHGRTWPRAPRGCQPSCKPLKSPDRPRAGCTRPSGATPSPRTTRKCKTSRACLNGRRPGRPPVGKGTPPRSWRGSARAQHPPRPSRAFARPASPARGERPCWRLALWALRAEEPRAPPSHHAGARARAARAGGRAAQSPGRRGGARQAFPRWGAGPASYGNGPPARETHSAPEKKRSPQVPWSPVIAVQSPKILLGTVVPWALQDHSSLRSCTVPSEWRENGSYCPGVSRLICMNSGAGRGKWRWESWRAALASAFSTFPAVCGLRYIK